MAVAFCRPVNWSRAFAAILLLAGYAYASEPSLKPWKGGATPPLSLDTLDGGRVDLAKLRGRVVVVNFWATWCDPCREEMPSFDRLREKMKGRPFDVLAVNFGESAARAAAFVAKEKISTPVLLDPYKKAAEDWKVKGLPMTFVVDGRGRVRYWTFGERDWSEGESFALLERMLKEAPRAGS